MKWCNELKALLENLKVYVKAHHLTGLTWNFKVYVLRIKEGRFKCLGGRRMKLSRMTPPPSAMFMQAFVV